MPPFSWITGFLEPKPKVNERSHYAVSRKYSSNLGKFPQWLELLGCHAAEMEQKDVVAAHNLTFKAWLLFIEATRPKPIWDMLTSVNKWVNQVHFVPDDVNWQTRDHWSTPAEFFAKGGDCEDFAATKYFTLKMLGIPTDRLRLVLLEDLHTHQSHAVLAVDIDETSYLLDNQMKQVMPAATVGHYRPQLALNENGWWQVA